MAAEKTFTNWFTRTMPRTWHLQRIETTTGRGIPDMNVCAGPHCEFWIEFKRGTKFPILRPEQWAWLQRRAACGGKVFILHRYLGMPWALWDTRNLLVESCSGGLKITSPPRHTGFTADLLHTALLQP